MKEIYMLVAGGALILILGVALYLKKTENPPPPVVVDPLVGEFVESLNDDQGMKLLGLTLKYENLSAQIAQYLFEKVDADYQKHIKETK
jgi:hypothetical protein